MRIKKKLNAQQLKAVCDVIADTNRGLTKTELSRLLEQCHIQLEDDGKSYNGITYTIGLNKRDWLYNCFVNEINQNQTFEKIFLFIEKTLNPISYTNESSREKYYFLFEEINKVLLLVGLSVSKEGVLNEVIEAKSLDEVDRRVNNLRKHLYN